MTAFHGHWEFTVRFAKMICRSEISSVVLGNFIVNACAMVLSLKIPRILNRQMTSINYRRRFALKENNITEENRIGSFKRFGWQLKFIWEHEINEAKILGILK